MCLQLMVMAQWWEHQSPTRGCARSVLQDVVTIAWLSLMATVQSQVVCLTRWSMAVHTTTMAMALQARASVSQAARDLATARDRALMVKTEM